jgi:proteasome lid subunit RPN8/RPN11
MSRKTNSDAGAAKLNVREAETNEKRVRRSFPGPRGADVILRIAVERPAQAELMAHARESLDVEVCGVLIGTVCEDDEGPWVHVEAIIRGAAASQASTHVTFTQETWNRIHEGLERDHPKLRIVGWYHTHPGFGVEFSDMDLFIQKNFFGGPTQIALVTDPISGAVAVAVNTSAGIEYLPRYWVDGREQPCRAPDKTPSANTPPVTAPPDSVRALEARVGQLVQSFDELRRFHYRFLMTCGALFCVGLVVVVGYTLFKQWGSRLEPPKLNQIVPIPVQVGDKSVILGVAITEWQVPPELNSLLLQAEAIKEELAREAAKEAAQKNKTNSPPAK